jgi:acetyl-CoA carboxylase biotin carboxyl carrier protein
MARASEENQMGNVPEKPAEETAAEATQAASVGEDTEAATPVDWSEQVEFLRGLAAIVRDEELSELMIEQGGVRLNLRSRRPSIVPPDPAMPTVALPLGALGMDVAAVGAGLTEPADSAEAANSGPEEPAGTAIVSPMVGMFYRSKSPADPPFVQVGDHVEAGQIVGLVEAMKTFNEILSEVEGEISAIPALNGELVEAGTPLVIVK